MPQHIEEIHRIRMMAAAVLVTALSACAAGTLPLNSERIEQTFGSYGIEVLPSEKGLRRSSLYSLADGQPTCRTYAIVRFSGDVDNRLQAEHARVLAGGSLGEVFKSSDWSVKKQTLHIGSIQTNSSFEELVRLMRLGEDQIDDEQTLALHIYQLRLVKEDERFDYAMIIETHHPEYLTEGDLQDIYGLDYAETLSNASKTELIALIARGQRQ